MEWLTVRVYGLLIHNAMILVADEIIKERRITKFPGGGLEYGEGLKDALIREIREEMAVDATDVQHFYTTEFFQRSTFHKEPVQVISVYYTFQIKDPGSLPVIALPFAYSSKECREAFRWLPLADAIPDQMSLPIDRVVLGMVLDAWRAGRN